MGKRLLAAFLWFYTGWYVGAIIADILMVSPALGPILGTAAAGVIAGDPRGVIWSIERNEAPAQTSNLATDLA